MAMNLNKVVSLGPVFLQGGYGGVEKCPRLLHKLLVWTSLLYPSESDRLN